MDDINNLEIDGLNTEIGLSYNETEDIYKKALIDYYSDIEKKADMIEEYEENHDIHNYVVLVHSLKSSSRIIGATELSELAKSLEMAGNNNDLDLIHKETPRLLKMYRDFLLKLKPFVDSEKKEIIKKSVSISELKQTVYDFLEAVQNYDMCMMDDCISVLETYIMDEENEKRFNKISSLAKDLEYEECENQLNDWVNYLNQK